MLKLYYTPRTISIATAITLHEAGLEHQAVRVDFANAEQDSDAYRRINPKGRVPALVTEHGILTENGAIQDYVAALAPEAGLMPANPFAAAKMREAMYYLASTVHVNHAHRVRGLRWADAESSWADMAARTPANMTECCEHIEHHMLKGPFVLGEEFSLADPYLFVVCLWLPGDGVDMRGFAGISAFIETMNQRASVKAARERGMF